MVARVALGVIVLAGVSVAVSPDGFVSDSVVPDAVSGLFASCAEAATGTVNVAIAVDPGVVGGAPRGPETLCVTVPDGATGADVLVERARLLGRPPPRWAPSGLMCAIDGYPATGCGERVDGAYRYWSYHLGDEGSWSFARTGPAMRRATPARMEGWHFIAGANSPADPPPRVAPSSAAVCPPSAPPATVGTPTAPPAPVAPGAGPTGGDSGAAGVSDQSGLAAAATGTAGGTPGNAGAGPGLGSGSGSPGDATGDAAGDAIDGATGDAAGDGDATGDGDTGAGSASEGGSADGDEAMAAGRGPAMALVGGTEPSGSSDMPVAVVLLVVVVAAVGVGATVRSRRRGLS
jgi:hypothetical protein